MSEPTTKRVATRMGFNVTVRASDGRCVLKSEDHAFADLESLIYHRYERAAAAVADESVEEFRKMHPEDRLSAWAAAARVIGEIG